MWIPASLNAVTVFFIIDIGRSLHRSVISIHSCEGGKSYSLRIARVSSTKHSFSSCSEDALTLMKKPDFIFANSLAALIAVLMI